MHGREDRRRHFSATLLALALVLWAALVPSVASGAPGTDATTEVGVGSAGFLGAGGSGLGGSGTGGTDPQGSAPDEDTSHGGGATPGDAVAYDWPTGGPVGVLPGDAVLAAADGEVAFTGTVAGRGVVSIDHADGLRTTYEPLVPSVAAGDRVVAGQPIGVLARGHCPPPGCLHWGARRGTHDYVDPLGLLDDAPRPVRLLPLGSRLPALAPTPVLPTSSE
jgi:murein DD-endopeptidase MepM/ murein hydrolase activator NlpD